MEDPNGAPQWNLERYQDFAWIALLGAVGLVALAVSAVIAYSYLDGGTGVGNRMTLNCSSYLTGGYPTYARKGWWLTSPDEVAVCRQCPYECSSRASGLGDPQPNTYYVTLIYCPPGSRILGRHRDKLGDTYVSGCTD